MSKKAVLIDGNSLAYRAFYALPDTMRTASGITTNAVYGFTTMLLKILEKKPDFIAIAFDRAAPTFRHKEYAEYKATRQKAPPTLYEQMPLVRKVSEAFDIPIFELDGFEADDIIGTLAKQAEKKGFNVDIVTGDKDTLQIVDDKINVLTTRKGLSDIVTYDEEEIKKQYGLAADQMLDYKALKGDASDNIPGITGIGEKTATDLLQKFGTLDNLLKNLDKVDSDKLRAKIETGIEQAKMSKRLATIVTNVPVSADFEKANPAEVDWAKVMPIFEEFEFSSLIKKYSSKEPSTTVEEKRAHIKSSKVNYVTVIDTATLDPLIKELRSADAFAFDTETTGQNPLQTELVGLSFAIKPNEAYYIPVGHKSGKQLDIDEVLKALKPILEDVNIKKYGQNIKYDNEVMFNYGINVAGTAFDTMVAAYTLDPTSKIGLKSLAHGLLGKKMIDITELIGTGAKQITMAEVDIDVASDYSCSDADMTLQLVPILKKQIDELGVSDLLYKIEVPLVDVLTVIEENGVSIDQDILKEMSKETEAEMKHLETHIFAISGETFNINSPKQLQVILFDKLKLPVIKRTKTGASTDAEVLEELAVKFEIAKRLMDYRQLQKYKSTYIDVLPTLVNKKTGRIHTSFNQTITATGRLSSTNPNLQNIPAKGEMAQRIRQAFVPARAGWKILGADYSQIELRILAHLSGDGVFTKAFNEDKDIHKITASEVFGVPVNEVTDEMRDQAKVVNFGIIYGMSDFGLSKSLKIKKTEAAKYINTYFIKHSGVKKFIDQIIEQAKKDGYVCTLLGRKRPMPDINNPNNNLRQFAERTAINTPVQGTAADIIKVAMINIHNLIKSKKLKTKMILQVHDELVFEVPEDEVTEVKRLVDNEMVNAVKLNVPVKVHIGIGDNWAEAKS
jgi:DNA polymerase-1